jgi:predicted RNase H-like HicB family nuclease
MQEIGFTVIVGQDEEGNYIAHCPELKGCWSCGDTEEEALTNIREAIIGCLRTRLKWAVEDAMAVPQPLAGRHTLRLAIGRA